MLTQLSRWRLASRARVILSNHVEPFNKFESIETHHCAALRSSAAPRHAPPERVAVLLDSAAHSAHWRRMNSMNDKRHDMNDTQSINLPGQLYHIL